MHFVYLYISKHIFSNMHYIYFAHAKLDNWILNTSKVHAVGFWDKRKRQNEKNDNRRKKTKDK